MKAQYLTGRCLLYIIY